MPEKRTCHFFRYWFPVFFYCAVIFIQSSFPSPEEIPSFFGVDKCLHFTAYAVLGVLFLRALKRSRAQDRQKLVFVLAIIFTGMYGATDELHQHFVPTRSAEWWDLVADLMGGFVGAYAYQVLLRHDSVLGRI